MLYSDTILILMDTDLGYFLFLFHLVPDMQAELFACGFIGSDDFINGFVRNVRFSAELEPSFNLLR